MIMRKVIGLLRQHLSTCPLHKTKKYGIITLDFPWPFQAKEQMMEPKLSIELNVNFGPFNELKTEETIALIPSTPVEPEPGPAQPEYSPPETVVSRVVPFTPDISLYE